MDLILKDAKDSREELVAVTKEFYDQKLYEDDSLTRAMSSLSASLIKLSTTDIPQSETAHLDKFVREGKKILSKNQQRSHVHDLAVIIDASTALFSASNTQVDGLDIATAVSIIGEIVDFNIGWFNWDKHSANYDGLATIQLVAASRKLAASMHVGLKSLGGKRLEKTHALFAHTGALEDIPVRGAGNHSVGRAGTVGTQVKNALYGFIYTMLPILLQQLIMVLEYYEHASVDMVRTVAVGLAVSRGGTKTFSLTLAEKYITGYVAQHDYGRISIERGILVGYYSSLKTTVLFRAAQLGASILGLAGPSAAPVLTAVGQVVGNLIYAATVEYYTITSAIFVGSYVYYKTRKERQNEEIRQRREQVQRMLNQRLDQLEQELDELRGTNRILQ